MIRKIAYQTHLWLGLTVGLILMVLGFTGSSMVFRPELERASYEALDSLGSVSKGTPSPTPLEVGRQTLAEKYPGWRLRSIVPGKVNKFVLLPKGANEDQQADQESSDDSTPLIAAVDRTSGEVLGVQPMEHSWLIWVRDLHTNLLSGRNGRFVNGFVATGLMILSISGLILWLPKKQWRLSKRTSWKRQVWNIHNAAGVFFLLFLTIQGLSGAYFAFPNLFRAALGLAPRMKETAGEKSSKKKQPSGKKRLETHQIPLDTFVETAQTTWRNYRIAIVNLTPPPRQLLTIRGAMPGDPAGRVDASRLNFNLRTGKLTQALQFSTLPWQDKALLYLQDLHYARAGGTVIVKGLWFLLGLTPGVLYITGLLMWLNRTKAKWRVRTARRRSFSEISKESAPVGVTEAAL